MKFRVLIASLAVCVSVAFAAAPPVLVRGTIAAIDGKTITIRKDDGTSVSAAILPTTAFAAVEPRRFDQLKATDFVGITAVPGPNDTLKAEEIHIIPLKGIGEGSYPWDHHPGAKSSVTNGTVATVQAGPVNGSSMTNGTITTTSSGMKLQVTYHGASVVNGKCVGLAAQGGAAPCTGVAAVTVPPSTPIVAIVLAKPTDAKAGLAVFANLAAGPDGKLVAGSLVMEKNGVKPQM